MKNLDYWAGFLIADGCLTTGSHNNRKLVLELKESDYVHLIKFKRDLELPNKIQTYTRELKGKLFKSKWATTCKVTTQKPDKVKLAASWGVLRNKTRECKANKRQYHSKSFWRGIIDGDGCLSCRLEPSRNRIVPKITLTTGSEELIRQWKLYIMQYCMIEANYHERKRGGTFDLKVTGNKALTVVTFLYKDAKISLDRKQAIAQEIMSLSWKKKQKN